MANMKLTEADMLADVGFVPAGVVEVMRKQQQGYVYIRP
jgi:intracellular sulfur oxidation DsrE/DsrF family protein